MQTENWKTVKNVLHEALKLNCSERLVFLDETGVSVKNRREVESLLSVEENARDFMSVAAGGFSKDFFSEDEEGTVGQKIGAYEIESEIGQGGMGAVYLAKRADGKFSQKVAIKMLKREFNTEKIRRRFNLEKHIQARLAHPNIAALLDAGTTADGVPFLVMEYIEGVPVDDYCRENALLLDERLKIFKKICAAVAFAHRNLIVHRDLKPSNILVTKDGNIKLLDFGISKLLDDAPDGENTLTIFGVMTPKFASPEQIKGETVATATDIYSLGVILFKMLTERFPYDFENKTNGNLLREIIDAEPTPPSEALSKPRAIDCKNEKSKDKIYQFQLSPALLKGDLDNIILKALRKNPERRYKTVEQFCADVERHIKGLPVLARPATFKYRAAKFYGRNKISVLAAVFVFLSLVAGVAVAASQASEARGQAQIASSARAVAETGTAKAKAEAEKAEKVTVFISKIIAYANPSWYAEGAKYKGEARVIDAVEDLSEKIDAEFAGEADVAAELHHKFAEVFLMAEDKAVGERLEKFEQRRVFHSVRALELRKQFYGERHELVAKDLFYAHDIIGKDDANQAELLMQAIEMMRETNPNNLNLPYMLEAYAACLILPGKYEKYHEPYRNAVTAAPIFENNYQIAESYLREALPVFRLHYKEENQAIRANECTLAYALAVQNKWDDFGEHYAFCKPGAKTRDDSESVKRIADTVEKTLAEKRFVK